MFDDRKDVMDLNEERQRELYEELGRLKPEDPKYKEIVNNLETLAKMQDEFETREQKRLDNNAKNDLEEAKLVIDQQKIENDKLRSRLDAFTRICYFIGSLGMGYYAYHSDKLTIPVKPFVKVKDDFMRLIGR